VGRMQATGYGWMDASAVEFRFRFWILALIFTSGFQLYQWDQVPARVALAGALTRFSSGYISIGVTQFLTYAGGAATVVTAAALRTWAAAYLNSTVVHDQRVHDSRLVADGPYRYLRNPLYLGMILVAFGIGLVASRSGFVLIIGMVFLLQYRLTRREESALLASQGASYRLYCATVPRLLPARRPRVPGSGANRNGDRRFAVRHSCGRMRWQPFSLPSRAAHEC
jgi:protein-S-isoprenylcysteine O-methyltransferase Ste14